MRNVTRCTVAVLAAVMTTAVVASLLQTQINIQALIALGAAVPVSTRLMVTVEDVGRFGPIMAAIAASALLPALLVAGRLARTLPRAWRAALLSVAAAIGLCVAINIMGLVTPMPALVEATRSGWGLLLMSLAGLPGGLVYARMTRPDAEPVSNTDKRYLMAALVLVLLPGLCFVAMSPRAAEPVPEADGSRYVVQTIASGLDRPWSVAILPDGRRLMTLMGGQVVIAPAQADTSNPVAGHVLPVAIDLKGLVFEQGTTSGLLEVVLDPDFAQNSLVYLSMVYGEHGNTGLGILRARLVGERLQDVRMFFRTPLSASSGNFGGRMAFLRDGTLALTVGDGLDWRERAQNPASHLGKVLRLDKQGRAPQDNPYYGQRGAVQEMLSLGHRNPQGIALDPVSGALLVSEHGARGGDEINLIVAGQNYGWPVVTGGIDYSFARVTPFTRLPPYRDPALIWTPSIAPAGLAVYAGDLFPQWQGDLFVPALKERSLRRVVREQGKIVRQERMLTDMNERIRDVKVAPDGALYVLTDGRDAQLLRITPAL